jgi:hypothetical protein
VACPVGGGGPLGRTCAASAQRETVTRYRTPCVRRRWSRATPSLHGETGGLYGTRPRVQIIKKARIPGSLGNRGLRRTGAPAACRRAGWGMAWGWASCARPIFVCGCDNWAVPVASGSSSFLLAASSASGGDRTPEGSRDSASGGTWCPCTKCRVASSLNRRGPSDELEYGGLIEHGYN